MLESSRMLDAEPRIRSLALVVSFRAQRRIPAPSFLDLSGTPTASRTANDWPFQFKGMEKEFTDPGTYYYTGDGQFYSPQFVRSLSEAGQTSTKGVAAARRATRSLGPPAFRSRVLIPPI